MEHCQLDKSVRQRTKKSLWLEREKKNKRHESCPIYKYVPLGVCEVWHMMRWAAAHAMSQHSLMTGGGGERHGAGLEAYFCSDPNEFLQFWSETTLDHKCDQHADLIILFTHTCQFLCGWSEFILETQKSSQNSFVRQIFSLLRRVPVIPPPFVVKTLISKAKKMQ
jgi:hypothetical protein